MLKPRDCDHSRECGLGELRLGEHPMVGRPLRICGGMDEQHSWWNLISLGAVLLSKAGDGVSTPSALAVLVTVSFVALFVSSMGDCQRDTEARERYTNWLIQWGKGKLQVSFQISLCPSIPSASTSSLSRVGRETM